MTRKRVRWETMDKSQIPLSRLSEQYFITCRTEGKTESTLCGYREKLGRFIRWCEDATLGDFSVELAREYISYLQTVPKYEGVPYRMANGVKMSAANVQNHVRVLRAFSSWLQREVYTEENVLARLKLPNAPRKMFETLSDEEIKRLFDHLDQSTATGCRNAVTLLLFLDTGLRCSELTSLMVDEVHIEDQWLKVMGKGRKERIVPFGGRASRLLQRYLTHFRPEPLTGDFLFLTLDGYPLTENAIRLIFARLAKRAGVSRLHIHLLRHTFATRYLLSGGDAFSLQQILGHTTLEMTRRYVDMVAVERAVKTKRLSPMDQVLMGRNGAPHARIGRQWQPRIRGVSDNKQIFAR
jgi:site-specific recombinase XerD